QIVANAGDRMDVGARHAASRAVLDRERQRADAFGIGAVEIARALVAGFARGLDEDAKDFIARLRWRYGQRPALTARLSLVANEMLRAPEVRQHILERPAAQSRPRPIVEIALETAQIDHRSDRGRSAPAAPGRREQHAAVKMALRRR